MKPLQQYAQYSPTQKTKKPSESVERTERIDSFQAQLTEMRASIPRHIIAGHNRTLLEGHITTLETGIATLRKNPSDDTAFRNYTKTIEATLQDFFRGVHVYTNKEGDRIVPIYIQGAHKTLSKALTDLKGIRKAPRMNLLKDGREQIFV